MEGMDLGGRLQSSAAKKSVSATHTRGKEAKRGTHSDVFLRWLEDVLPQTIDDCPPQLLPSLVSR
jgi:hypothetical protein